MPGLTFFSGKASGKAISGWVYGMVKESEGGVRISTYTVSSADVIQRISRCRKCSAESVVCTANLSFMVKDYQELLSTYGSLVL